jgi:ORF6N domain
MEMAEKQPLILVDQIEPLILDIRGQKVLLDKDLAELYGVAVKRLNEQVRRNRERFPEDFLFQLTKEEVDSLRSQNATLKLERGQHRKYAPYAFTEHGAIMAATILNSQRAVEVSVFVVRTFVKLRQLALTHKDLATKLNELERRVTGHDDAIRQLVQAIRQLMAPPPDTKPKRRIGFGREPDANT